MSDKKSNKILWWLGALIAILTLVLANALQWLAPTDYDKLLSIIPYSWQLTIWMTLIILILIAFLYSKAFPKPLSDKIEQLQIENEHRLVHPSAIPNQLKSLTKKEKECLKKFLDNDARTLKISLDDETAQGLHSIGMLQVVSPVPSFRQLSYKVSDIYWDYLRRNPNVLDL